MGSRESMHVDQAISCREGYANAVVPDGRVTGAVRPNCAQVLGAAAGDHSGEAAAPGWVRGCRPPRSSARGPCRSARARRRAGRVGACSSGVCCGRGSGATRRRFHPTRPAAGGRCWISRLSSGAVRHLATCQRCLACSPPDQKIGGLDFLRTMECLLHHLRHLQAGRIS